MFIHTTKVSNILIFIDTLISINGRRPVQSVFQAKIDTNTRIVLDPAVSDSLKYIIKKYRYAVVTQYSHESLDLIRAKLRPQIEFGACFAEDRGSYCEAGAERQIKKAVHTLNLKPCETVLFTGDATTVVTASENNLGTICWMDALQDREAVFEAGPDFFATGAKDIEDILTGKKRGYYSEVIASPPELFTGTPEGPRYQYIPMENSERVGESIFVGGRYFSTKDARYLRHALSLRIINSKDNMANQKGCFSRIMGNLITAVAAHVKRPPDLITRVPPKPGQYDRLAEQLGGIQPLLKKKFPAARIVPRILKCPRVFPSQKGVGFNDRRQNVRGVFTVEAAVSGKIVYVLDDIVTSGSTLKEACHVLYAAGAKAAVPVAMAYHPRKLSAKTPDVLCKQCKNGQIKERCGKDGTPFYGCSNFYPGGCKSNLAFEKGVFLINRSLKISLPDRP